MSTRPCRPSRLLPVLFCLIFALTCSPAGAVPEESALTPVQAGAELMPHNPTLWLQDAIRSGSLQEIEAAQSMGARTTEECLWLAAAYGDQDILRFLLQHMHLPATAVFSIAIAPGPGQDGTAPGLAIRRRLLTFLSGDHQETLIRGVTLLHIAAAAGNAQTARFLLSRGVPVDAAMSNGNTPLLVAYSSWLRSWNPMHMAHDAFQSLRRDTNFPGFIYFLLDMGADRSRLDTLTDAKRDATERYVVGLTTDFAVPMRDGSFMSLESILEEACTNTAWGLVDMRVFTRKKSASSYCHMTVVFFGRLKKDGSSIRIPFIFLDNHFCLAGDRKIPDYVILKNQIPMDREEMLNFWENLGVDLKNRAFWTARDADF